MTLVCDLLGLMVLNCTLIFVFVAFSRLPSSDTNVNTSVNQPSSISAGISQYSQQLSAFSSMQPMNGAMFNPSVSGSPAHGHQQPPDGYLFKSAALSGYSFTTRLSLILIA